MSMHRAEGLPECVVLVLVDLAGGGTQKVVAGLAVELLDAGTMVTIITNDADDDRWGAVRNRARIVELRGRLMTSPRSGLPPVLTNLRWLRRAVLDLRATVRVTGKAAPVVGFLPGTNILTMFACLGMRRHIVLSERNDHSRQRLSLPMRLARRLLYRAATVVTTNSDRSRVALQNVCGRVPVRVVRNPPPPVGDPARPAESRRMLCVGRLTRHKRHRDVIAAFAEVAGSAPGWTLRILGDGPEAPALSQQARDLGIQDRVEFLGWSSRVAEELAAGAIYVHASEYEGMSNAVLEAMTAGLPVLISETALSIAPTGRGHPDVVTTFPTGEIDELARAMRALVADGDLRDRQGHAARELVLTLVGRPLSEWAPILQAGRPR